MAVLGPERDHSRLLDAPPPHRPTSIFLHSYGPVPNSPLATTGSPGLPPSSLCALSPAAFGWGSGDRSVTCSLAHTGLLSHGTYRSVLLAVPSSPPHGLLKSPCALSPLSPLRATLTLAPLQLWDGAALTSQPGL